MNKVVISSELAKTIAELTQCTETEAEEFVRETFRLAAERLDSDKRIEIPGIGVFAVTDESVEFAPDRNLASELNAPFSMFEAAELPDDYEDNYENREPVMVTDATEAAEAIAESAEFEEQEDAGTQQAEEEIDKTPDAPTETEHQPGSTEHKSTTNSNSYIHWLWAAACLLCFGLGWFVRDYMEVPTQIIEQEPVPCIIEEENHGEDIEESTAIEESTVIDEPQKIVTDTISSMRYLTTMARSHYGVMEYWVYIYEANADKLGHPDRLSAGTVVVIPDINSVKTHSVEEAKQKAAEIYSRFN